MPWRKKLVRHSAWVTAASLFESMMSMLCGFTVAKLLGPMIQGIWQTAMLVRTYADLGTLGQGLGMVRQVAVAAGAGDADEIERQRDTSWTWYLVAFGIVAAGLALYAALARADRHLQLALWAVAGAVMLSVITHFLNLWFKARSLFGVLSTVSVVTGCCFGVTIGLIVVSGFRGLLGGYVLMSAVVAAASWGLYRGPFRLGFSKPHWVRSMKIGLPLFFVSLSGVLFATLDRVIIVARLGFSDMGFYSVANMFFFPVQTVLLSAAVVLAPAAYGHYGARGREGISAFFLAPLSVLLSTVPVAACALLMLVPPVVRWLLPEYVPGILPAQIVLLGLPFAGAAAFCHNVVVATGRPWGVVAAAVLASAAKLAGAWLLLGSGFGLPGVAASTAGSMLLYFALMLWLAVRTSGATALDGLKLAGIGTASLGAALPLCAVVREVQNLFSAAWWSRNALAFGLSAALAALPLLWGWRQALRLLALPARQPAHE